MGKVEIIIILSIVFLISTMVILFVENSKKIKKSNIKNETKPDKQDVKVVEKSEDSGFKKDDIANIFKEVSKESEEYITSIASKKEEQNKTESKAKLKNRDGAIVLGRKSSEVYIIEDEIEDDAESVSDIVAQMDDVGLQDINKKYAKRIKRETSDAKEEGNIAEEFKGLSKNMKVLMVTSVFSDKKSGDKKRGE